MLNLPVDLTTNLRRAMVMTHREQKCAENYNKRQSKYILKTAISILVISNHNSFRVLYDEIASVYFI